MEAFIFEAQNEEFGIIAETLAEAEMRLRVYSAIFFGGLIFSLKSEPAT